LFLNRPKEIFFERYFGFCGLKAYYFFIIAALASLFIQVIVIIFGFDGRPCILDTEPEGD